MKRRLIFLYIFFILSLLVGCGDRPSSYPSDTPKIFLPTNTPEVTKASTSPTLTPTESKLVWLPVPPKNPTIIQLTDNSGWRETWPIWSPDGSQIMFLSNRDCAIRQEEEGWETPWLCEKEEIYLMDADGSNQIQLTDTQSDDSLFVGIPTWSPDGESIAVSFHYTHERYLQRVFSFSVDQIDQAPLGMDDMDVLVDKGEEYVVSHFRWSPDEKKYAYEYQKYLEFPLERWDIVIVDIESGEEVFRKTTTGDTICFFETWSPKGDEILITCEKTLEVGFIDNIYWVDVNEGDEMLLIEDARNPIWSPDGNWILYYSIKSKQKELFHVESSEVIPLPYDGDIGGIWSWSPDGKWLAITQSFDGKKSDIYLIDMSWLAMEWDE
jgi:Tol biopolymer transport system component